MRLPRFAVPEISDETLLDRRDSRHARDVLRLTVGDQAVLFDGSGREAVCEVVSVERGVRLRRLEERRVERELAVACVAAAACPKGDRLSFLVQKLTELGAARFIPLRCERSVAGPGNAERLEKIAREAAKQCGRNVVPEIAVETPLGDFLTQAKGARVFYGAPDAPRTFLQALQAAPLPLTPHPSVVYCVGPEGGFAPREVELFEKAGATPVRLAPAILRIETAAIAFQSVLAQFSGNRRVEA